MTTFKVTSYNDPADTRFIEADEFTVEDGHIVLKVKDKPVARLVNVNVEPVSVKATSSAKVAKIAGKYVATTGQDIANLCPSDTFGEEGYPEAFDALADDIQSLAGSVLRQKE